MRKITGKRMTAAFLGFGTVFGATLTTTLAATSPTTYTVKAGDSLWGIGQQLGVSVANLVNWNQISNPDFITVGERLTVSSSKAATSTSSATSSGSSSSQASSTSGSDSYVVQSGDSLWSIAQHYTVSVQELVSWNHISNADYITVGEQLTVSASKTTGSSSSTSTASSSSSAKSQTSSTSTSKSSTVNRQALVNYAETFLGDPYKWGGKSPSGFDCSGFVQTVFAHFGITALEGDSYYQATVGSAVSKSNLQLGDLVFFNTTGSANSHVGIYTGNGNFISATTHGVMIYSLSNSYWEPLYDKGTNPLG